MSSLPFVRSCVSVGESLSQAQPEPAATVFQFPGSVEQENNAGTCASEPDIVKRTKTEVIDDEINSISGPEVSIATLPLSSVCERNAGVDVEPDGDAALLLRLGTERAPSHATISAEEDYEGKASR